MSDFDPKDVHKDVTSDFAPEDIIASVPSSEKMSAAQAGLLGAEQGLTLGNSDEMTGGIGAGMDKTQALLSKLGLTDPSPTEVNAKLAAEDTKGDIGPKSTLDLYKEMRDAERAKIKKGQEEHPYASFAGNLAGGALLAPIAGALTPIKTAADAGRLAKIGAGAYNAAALGGLGALGSSEATNPEQLTKDVESSATGMGIIGGTIPAIGGALNSVGKTQTWQDLLKKLQAGKQKLNLDAPEFMLNARDKIKEFANAADDALRNKIGEIFGTKGKILDQLENSGVKVDTASILKDFANKVGSSPSLDDNERKAIENTLEVNFKNGFTKSPKELEKLLIDLKDLKDKVRTTTGYKAITNAIDDVRGLQNNLSPELQHLNRQADQVIEAGSALTGSNPLDYQNSKKNQSMIESMANQLENQDNYRVQSKMNDVLNKGLSTSNNRKISGLSETVPEAASAIEQTKPISEYMRLAKQQQTSSPFNPISIAGSAANKTGLGITATQDFLKSGVKKLSDMDKNTLGGIGTKMAQVGGEAGKKFAESLQNASDANPESKNAIMFGLMQQPQFRELYHKVGETGLDIADKLNPWSTNKPSESSNGQ